MSPKTNAIVFDLDETLGSFSQPYHFWNLLKKYTNDSDLEDKYFFSLLDLFPQFLRPNLLKLLKSIKLKKQNKTCDYVMIYTNNNGPNYWATLIQSYLHHKLKYNLFDQIIRAFKINGKQVEICRTSYGKSYKDFIGCSKLPSNTTVCFIDDNIHNDMNHDNVWYFNISPYNCNVDYMTLCKKYYKHNKLMLKSSFSKFYNFINTNTHNYKLEYLTKPKPVLKLDYAVTDYLITQLNIIFPHKQNKTQKNKNKNKNKNNHSKTLKM